MSVTKFLAFNDTMLPYSRVILLESDITLFRNLDELFLLPPAVTAMSRAYWTLPAQKMLSPHLVVFEPSEVETGRLMEAASTFQAPDSENVDIGVMNKLYADSAMVLPHRRYGLVTSEYRTKNHTNYLGNDYEVWNPDKALREASLVHFSGDSPIPKPWIMWPQNMLHDMVPKCDYKPGTAEESGCRGREIWMELYNNFRKRRKVRCRSKVYI